MSARPWTMEGLACVSMLAMAGVPSAHIGLETDRLASEVDLALWALVGRTPEQAVQRLNGLHGLVREERRALVAEGAEIARGLRSLASDDDEILTEPLPSLRQFLARAAETFEMAFPETRP